MHTKGLQWNSNKTHDKIKSNNLLQHRIRLLHVAHVRLRSIISLLDECESDFLLLFSTRQPSSDGILLTRKCNSSLSYPNRRKTEPRRPGNEVGKKHTLEDFPSHTSDKYKTSLLLKHWSVVFSHSVIHSSLSHNF